MRTALYIRVSTMEQAEEGYSIGVQEQKLRHFAAAQEHSVVDVYADKGYSGKSLARPAMERLIGDIKARKIDLVLIYKLDRLSRRVKDVLDLVEMFENYSVTLYSLTENLDLSSPFGRAALKMSATFSELERETIVERMAMGKTARAKSGLYTCPGKPPFGYKLDKANDRMVVVENEAEAILKIYDLYINQGFSFRRLYDYCREAYPDIKHFNNPMCCKPIIKRPLYAGYFRHKGELIRAINLPPIMPYEMFLKAQSVLAAKGEGSPKTIDCSPYLLTGLLYCGQCGNRYVGKLYDRAVGDDTDRRYQYRRYGCAARVKRDKVYHNAKCTNAIIPAQELEDYIENFISELCFSEYVDKGFEPGTIDNLMAEHSALKSKKDKLLDLYVDGTIDKETLSMRLVELEAKLEETKTLLASETEKVQNAPIGDIKRLQDKAAHYAELSKREKLVLLRNLIKSIVLNGDKIIISLNVK